MMTRIRVVLSNSSSRWGGVHKVTELLTRGLQARGHEVVVFGYPGSMLEERMRDIAPFEPILRGMDFNPAVLWRTTLALRRYRPDVVVALMKKDVTMTAVAAKLLGIPVVVRHANERPLGSGQYWRTLYGSLPARHVTNADATKRMLLASASWLRDQDIDVIYNGVNADVYESAPPADLGVPSGALAVGFAGSFEARKGVKELAQAWREVAAAVPSAHLVLVGKGTLESEMKAILADAPRVHWAGYRTDMPAVLKALDVLVLPSYVEGAPNIVMEAMAAGVPVVATAVSGTPELVRDGVEARLLPPRDSQALARSLVEVLSSRSMREAFAAAANDRVKQLFGVERMIGTYERMLTGLKFS